MVLKRIVIILYLLILMMASPLESHADESGKRGWFANILGSYAFVRAGSNAHGYGAMGDFGYDFMFFALFFEYNYIIYTQDVPDENNPSLILANRNQHTMFMGGAAMIDIASFFIKLTAGARMRGLGDEAKASPYGGAGIGVEFPLFRTLSIMGVAEYRYSKGDDGHISYVLASLGFRIFP